MPGLGAHAAELLARSGLCTMAPGLTDEEVRAVEARYGFVFHTDHRELLTVGLPTGPSWPDWRHGDEMTLRMHLGLPARELARAGVANALIVKAPRMIPVYGHAFTPEAAHDDRAVWAVDGGRARRVADDLLGFVRRQLGQPVEVSAPTVRLAVWDGVEDPEFVDPTQLPVPPFSADPAVAEFPSVRPPRDPATHFAALGLDLGSVTRHDDVLAHGAPMWTTSATPGLAAVELWAAVRDLFPTSGLWPVLITAATWHRIGDRRPEDVALLGAQLDGAAWLSTEFDRRTSEVPLPRGVPSVPGSTHWATVWQGMYRVTDFDALALIPTPAPWLVPALLGWNGAVNWDVLGAEHAAVLRRWWARWGVELLALDDETAVLKVNRPPNDGVEALAAAVEVYLYCGDVIDDWGAGDLDALAPALTGGLWPLWWD